MPFIIIIIDFEQHNIYFGTRNKEVYRQVMKNNIKITEIFKKKEILLLVLFYQNFMQTKFR